MKNQETRLRKLRDIARKLETGQGVDTRTLKNWLCEHYQTYLEAWQEQQDLREELKHKPIAVQEYEQRLHNANFYNSRAEALEAKGSAAQGNFEDQALNEYAEALATVQQQVQANPSLQQWFDRDVFGSENDEVHPAPGHMPLPVTSRSNDNRGGGILSRWQTKTETKLQVVEKVIADLERELGERTEQDEKEQLEKKLGRKLSL
ncbi:hypothetical protein ACQ5SP_15925 [Rhodovulum sp. YNF3179]|uniref:hypothetical protein n=1 Tax=Rhodovulum sp. YNF3179 TaxID=3425127 RepID=UPI003D327057